MLKEVDDLKAKLISGEIVVPNYFDLKPGQKEMGTPPMATPPSVADATEVKYARPTAAALSRPRHSPAASREMA